MNSLMSVILVIVMVFSMAGGAIPTEGPASFEAKLSIDSEALLAAAGNGAELPEEEAQPVKAVGDIINALTLKGVADKEALELALFAGEDVLLSLGVKNAAEGSTFASSLLGSQVVFTSAELLEMMKQQMMASMTQNASGMNIEAVMTQLQNLDKEQMQKDSEEWLQSLLQSFEEKKGETETGEFAADGMTFTARTPVNMTYTELMDLLLNKAKELLAKESFQLLLQAYGMEDINTQLDEAIGKLKETPAEEMPDLQMAVYSDEAENAYLVCDMTRTAAATEEQPAKSERIYIGTGSMNGLGRMHIAFNMDGQTMDMTAAGRDDGSTDIQATVNADGAAAEVNLNKDPAGNMDMVWDIKAEQGSGIIHVKTEAAEDDRTNFSMDLYFGGSDKKLLSITGSAGKGGEMVSVFEGEDLTVVPMEKLMDTQDTTASTQLSMTLMANLLKAVTVLTRNVPENTAEWINTQVTQMMNPQPAETAVPQEEPAAVGE